MWTLAKTCHLAARECIQRPCQLLEALDILSLYCSSQKIDVPLWMASASLSGISMLNSCDRIRACPCLSRCITNLLNGHYNLNSVQTVQTKIVREVCGRRKLPIISTEVICALSPSHTFVGSETCKKLSIEAPSNLRPNIPYRSCSIDQLSGSQPLPFVGQRQQNSI